MKTMSPHGKQGFWTGLEGFYYGLVSQAHMTYDFTPLVFKFFIGILYLFIIFESS